MGCALRQSFERSCRLCAQEQDVTVVMFSREAEPLLLQNKLHDYLLIQVEENDGLPKNICIKCCSQLQSVCDFIDSARRAQEVLLSRSLLINQMKLEDLTCTAVVTPEVTIEPDILYDQESNSSQMEISVDPMTVLQNNDMIDVDENDRCYEPPNYLQCLESENVTIKLIRKYDNDELKYKPEPKEPEPHNNVNNGIVLVDVSTKPFPCMVCRRSFLTELALMNHSWIHNNEDKGVREYRCTSCDESFEYKSELVAHIKEHKNSVTCSTCGRVFRTPENLALHMQTHISPCLAYVCKVCGRAYNTSSNLKTHSITHSNERPYKCSLCKKSFKRNQDLKFHTNQHTGEKPYKCPFCDKSFASSGNCYSHRNRMHPGKKLTSTTSSAQGRRAKKKIPLNGVEVKLNGQSTSPVQPPNKGYKYKCQTCGHGFMRRDNYTYHLYQHTGVKPFKCSYCTEKFVTRKGWQIHHDLKHPHQDRTLALLSRNLLLK